MTPIAPWRWLVSGLAIVGLAGFLYAVPFPRSHVAAPTEAAKDNSTELGQYLRNGYEIKTSFTLPDGKLIVVIQSQNLTHWCDTVLDPNGFFKSRGCYEPVVDYLSPGKPDPVAAFDIPGAPLPEDKPAEAKPEQGK